MNNLNNRQFDPQQYEAFGPPSLDYDLILQYYYENHMPKAFSLNIPFDKLSWGSKKNIWDTAQFQIHYANYKLKYYMSMGLDNLCMN